MADYLLTIASVRAKSTPIFQLALEDDLTNFDSHFDDASKLDSCLDFIVSLINRDFGKDYNSIPPHGRWQHLEAGGVSRVTKLVTKWHKNRVDQLEITRRLIDLFVVSVFLDAGAGDIWKFTEVNEDGTSTSYGRSEGLAVASYYMFAGGGMANDDVSDVVNAKKLFSITVEQMKSWLQIDSANTMTGFEGRVELLRSLSQSLWRNGEIFGGEGDSDNNRPGNIVDYLIKKCGGTTIDMTDLWDALMTGFNSIWKSRLVIEGKSLGDAWYCQSAAKVSSKKLGIKLEDLKETDKIVPFHKLTQWLTYSLLIPLKKYGNFSVRNEELLTGLPEYRNGGLLIDFGLLSIKPEALTRGMSLGKEIPFYKPDDDLIVEWRSCTVGFLDYILPLVNEKLGIKGSSEELVLPQLIEAGSWKAGREIAAKKRPSTKGPPIGLDSDGTVF